ncbi:MAG: Aspartyl aminopeptidase [Clostridia bacterium]|nr:Aspartyl aminopeptidase [Clostridia bacterium]
MNSLLTDNLLTFIDRSPTMFHTISTCKDLLHQNGFLPLDPSQHWSIKQGGKYYTSANDSALIAFCVNSLDPEADGFKIVSSHSDVPGFRIKPNPQMTCENYVKLNTEVYGGPILNTSDYS